MRGRFEGRAVEVTGSPVLDLCVDAQGPRAVEHPDLPRALELAATVADQLESSARADP